MERMSEEAFQALADEVAQAIRPIVFARVLDREDALLHDRIAACVGAMTGLQLELIWSIKRPDMRAVDALAIMNERFGADAEETLREHFATEDTGE